MPSRSPLKRSNVTTLSSIFKSKVDTSPKSEAFRFFNTQTQNLQSISWVDAYQNMIQIKSALASENFQPGDRILLAMKNSPEWVYIE